MEGLAHVRSRGGRARAGAPLSETLRFAYADPPYPQRSARCYRNHPDYAGEVDHAALLGTLAGYDGWALSTGAHALQDVLALCPAGVRVAVWHKTNAEPTLNKTAWWHYSWEPVIVKAARARRDVRDVFSAGAPTGVLGGKLKGQKPRGFAEWVFRLMGAEPGDELADLYRGSGAVAQAWESYSRQLNLTRAGAA